MSAENGEKKTKKRDYKTMRRIFRRMFLLVVCVLVVLIVLFLLLVGFLVEDSVLENDIIEPQTSLIIVSVIVSLLLISQVVAVLWMNRITRPAEEIIKAVDKVAQGDFSTRIDTAGFRNEMLEMGNNLNKMIEELGSIEVMRSDFVSNVSHEFRAPLSSIQGYVTLLSSPKSTDEQKQEYFDLLQDSTRQLSSLVDSVLKLSRLQSQNIIAQPAEYRLDEQLRRAVLMFEMQWSEKELELELDMPECSYFGCEELLNQVWVNLIGNAVKFTPKGGKIGIKLDDSGEDYIKVTVYDSGEGMSEEVRRHVFEKFYQGDSSRKSMGNGLGLALVKTICQLTDSEIEVRSEKGRGSAFTVSLPR